MNVTLANVLILYIVFYIVYILYSTLSLIIVIFFIYVFAFYLYFFNISKLQSHIKNISDFSNSATKYENKDKTKNLIIYRRYMFTKLFIELI